MSRTDKDVPAWLRNFEHGLIDHDHRHGRCRVATLADVVAYNTAPRHHVCAKHTRREVTCTPDAPWRDWRGPSGCWDRVHETIYDRAGRPVGGRWHTISCPGHIEYRYDRSIACSCDDTAVPTCTPRWVYGRCFRPGGVPRDERRNGWHGPERARERIDLAAMAREYNTYGDLEDGDFANHQVRGASNYWRW